MTPQEFRIRRTHLGLSQTALGERLGVTKKTIIAYEDETGNGPPPMAALALKHLALEQPAGADATTLDFAVALDAFLDMLLIERNADGAIKALEELESIASKRRPFAMGHERACREARTIAFEYLTAAIENDRYSPQSTATPLELGALAKLRVHDLRRNSDFLEPGALARALAGGPLPTTSDYQNRLARALLGTPDIAQGIDGPSKRQGIGDLKFEPSLPPLSGGITGLAAQKFKRPS